MLKSLFVLSLCVTAIPAIAKSDETKKTDSFRVFSHYGFAFTGGTLFLEKSESGRFHFIATYGLDLNAEIFATKHHRAEFQLGYYKPLKRFDDGSEQYRVVTSHHMTDVSIGYIGRVIFFLFEIKGGISLGIVSLETQIYDLGIPERVDEENPELTHYRFPDKNLVESEKSFGLSVGSFARLGIGIDVGNLLLNRPHLLEFRLGAEYVRRGERNEIHAAYAWTFWPTALKSKQ